MRTFASLALNDRTGCRLSEWRLAIGKDYTGELKWLKTAFISEREAIESVGREDEIRAAVGAESRDEAVMLRWTLADHLARPRGSQVSYQRSPLMDCPDTADPASRRVARNGDNPEKRALPTVAVEKGPGARSTRQADYCRQGAPDLS